MVAFDIDGVVNFLLYSLILIYVCQGKLRLLYSFIVGHAYEISIDETAIETRAMAL